MLVLGVGCLCSKSLLKAGPTRGRLFKTFPGISQGQRFTSTLGPYSSV